MNPLSESDRQKFERLKEQAELMLEWIKTPFPLQHRYTYDRPGLTWFDTITEPTWNLDSQTYRRKPEPTLAEINAKVKERWEAMVDANMHGANIRFVVELVHSSGIVTQLPAPNWDDSTMSHCEYRIVELSEPKIVPYTFETCPLGAVCVWESAILGDVQIAAVLGKSPKEVLIGISRMTWEEAFRRIKVLPDPTKPNERRHFGTEVLE